MPVGTAIHSVFHVSQLKKYINRGQNISPTLPISDFASQL
jgi:hypothetical protein